VAPGAVREPHKGRPVLLRHDGGIAHGLFTCLSA
jgi:hypothetical protein